MIIHRLRQRFRVVCGLLLLSIAALVWFLGPPETVILLRQREDIRHIGQLSVFPNEVQNISKVDGLNNVNQTTNNNDKLMLIDTARPPSHLSEIKSDLSKHTEEPDMKPDLNQLKAADTKTEVTNKPRNYLTEPIDHHNYSYIHNPNSTCFDQNGEKVGVYLIFFVITSPRNFDRRQLIRGLYGSKRQWPVFKQSVTKTVFLLGATSNQSLQGQIDNESRLFGDIVQETFVDSYLNLTRKTIMGFKWVTNFCRHARFAMKLDDDTMINQVRLLDILRNAPATNFATGHVLPTPPVIRNKFSKYYISEEFYPKSHYPTHFIGVGYVMSTDLLEAIYRTAVTTPLYPWEDVFVGMCFEKIGVKLNPQRFFLQYGSPANVYDNNAVLAARKYVMFMNQSKENMFRLWTACSLHTHIFQV